MKRIFFPTLLVLMFIASYNANAQGHRRYKSTLEYNPFTFNELYTVALQRQRTEEMLQAKFIEYSDYAYRFYNNGYYSDCLRYIGYALSTGYYNASIYFLRGAAYEQLKHYRDAFNAYTHAYSLGYEQAKYEAVRVHNEYLKTH